MNTVKYLIVKEKWHDWKSNVNTKYLYAWIIDRIYTLALSLLLPGITVSLLKGSCKANGTRLHANAPWTGGCADRKQKR